MRDVVIIGGGPAGIAAAITAARQGADVLLLEQGRYPRHKVCGEFVSPESLSLLGSLLADTALLRGAPCISRARLFLGASVFEAQIAPPAASVARIELDAALWQAAESDGAECRQQVTVVGIRRLHHGFKVASSSGDFAARTVLDASGRWSRINQAAAIKRGWLGLKTHVVCPDPQDSTDLYFFPGGYCGVQPVGNNRLNLCAMVQPEVASSLEEVLACHPRLAEASRGWRRVMETVATSPLVFRSPNPEDGGVLRAGDAAGFIDPFAGDGISLALQSGALAARLLARVWNGDADASDVAHEYRREYTRRFGTAFRSAGRLRRLLTLPSLVRAPLLPLLRIPAVASFVVRKTRAA